jgi:hypothetical protein
LGHASIRFNVGEFREILGLDFAQFNISLIAAGENPDVDPERHRTQHIAEHEIGIINALRNALRERLANTKMRPLYAARISDLGPRELVRVKCACGHTELLTAAMLATAGVVPERKVLDLGARMRCRECDERGRAVVSVRWGR